MLPSRRRGGTVSRLSLDDYNAAVESLATGAAPLAFDDTLHAVVTTARPSSRAECEAYSASVAALVQAAEAEADKWKLLVLALVRRRYHAKAPAAVASVEDADQGAGDGERLLFYLAVRVVHRLALQGHALAAKAAAVLCRLAPLAGGTRDICALIEQLGAEAVAAAHPAVAPSGRVLPALLQSLQALLLGGGELYTPLGALLGMAAEMLDADLQLVRAQKEAQEEGSSDKRKRKAPVAAARATDAASEGLPALLSTIGTFLPHHDRGASGSFRKLVQSLAELLIWARTEAASEAPGFADALDRLVALAAAASDGSESQAEECVRRMQTAIRRLRKEINASAREQGFALCTLFALDPASISLSMVRRGKAGDVAALKRLATKAGDSRVLQLIAKRSVDENKAVPFESIRAMQRSWVPLDPVAAAQEDHEIAQLTRAIQRAAVAETIERLRAQLPSDATRRQLTIACLDGGAINQAAAVLVAAAHHPVVSQPVELTEAEAVAEAEAAGEAAQAARASVAASDATKGKAEQQAVDSPSPSELRRQRTASTDMSIDDPAGGAVGGGGGDGGGSSAAADEEGAPHGPSARLLLGENEVDASSLAKVLALLDAIFAREATAHALPDEAATTKEVQNLIERHLRPAASMILFTAADVKLEARVLAKLQAQGSTIHAHVNDEVMARLEREGATVGDVTISLAWDDRNDLDLHVITPKRNHIYFSNDNADGGRLDVDMNGGGPSSREPVENVFFGSPNVEAERGSYTVYVLNYAYHEPQRDKPVPFRVSVRKNGEVTEYRGETAARATGDASRVDVVTFEYAGRVAAAPAELPSALEAANLVALTASVGSTLDALRGLMRVGAEVAELERVRELVHEEGDEDEPQPSSAAAAAAAAFLSAMEGEEGEGEEMQACTSADVVGAAVAMESHGAELAAGRQPALASRGRFEVTSRERLIMQLARLPSRFHAEVAAAFGGPSLLELMSAKAREPAG